MRQQPHSVPCDGAGRVPEGLFWTQARKRQDGVGRGYVQRQPHQSLKLRHKKCVNASLPLLTRIVT